MDDPWSTRRVIVTGGEGFLGGYDVLALERRGCRAVLVPRHADYDLTKAQDIARMYDDMPADMVIHLAAVVGGIGAWCGYLEKLVS